MNKAFFIAVLIFLCAFSVFAQNAASVRVNADSIVSADRVALGDIAVISGGSNVVQVERLKNVALGYAPQPGMTREISRDKISLAIAAAGFSAKDFALNAFNSVRVRRESQAVENDVLRAAIETAVLSDLQIDGVTARVVRLDLPARFELPTGKIAVRANANNARSLFAPFVVALEIAVDGSVARRVSATVEIEAFADVLVAARDLTAREKIAASDVKIEKRRLEKPLADYLRDPKKLRGAIAARNLSKGAELTSNAVVAGYAIKSGDAVKVVAKSGDLQIIVAGEARAAGRIGDRIAVKNQQSGANLQAVVVDEGLVQINF